MSQNNQADIVTNPTRTLGKDRRGKFGKGNRLAGSRKGRPNRCSGKVVEDILEAYQRKGGVKWLAKLEDRLFASLLRRVLPREVHSDKRITVEHRVGTDVLGAIRALLDQQTPAARTAIDVESRPVGLLPSPLQAEYDVAEQVQQDTPADVQAVAGDPEDDESVGQCAPDEPTE